MQPPEVFYKKGVLKIFAKITGKHLPRSLFFNKVADMNFFLKKRFRHRCFPVKFARFLRNLFTEHLRETTSEDSPRY